MTAPSSALAIPKLLRLLRLASPAFPVGGFSYSRGLEGAVAAGVVHDEASAADFIVGVLERSVCPLDGAILWRTHAAAVRDDFDAVARYGEFLRACRESRELQLEDERMGLALRRLLEQLELVEKRRVRLLPASFTCLFAVTAVLWEVDADATLAGYFFAYCEAQVSAALRLLPIGQTSGQRILDHCHAIAERCVMHAASLSDDQIGNFAPGLALLSAHHETQYSRLFRS